MRIFGISAKDTRCLKKGLLFLVDPDGVKLSRGNGRKLSSGSRQQESLRAKAITWNPNKEFMVL